MQNAECKMQKYFNSAFCILHSYNARMRRLILLALLASPLLAAEHVTVVRAARLIDGRGGAIVSPATITVQGNKIVAVGSKAPDGADVIDLGDVTLLPGLIDAPEPLPRHGDLTPGA